MNDLGKWGEEFAANEYKKLGFKVIDRNVKIIGYKQLGEIDLVLKKGRSLVFVEVKTRSGNKFMDPIESVTWRKQGKLLKAVKAYIKNHEQYSQYGLRLDVAIAEPPLDGHPGRVYIIEDAIQDNR